MGLFIRVFLLLVLSEAVLVLDNLERLDECNRPVKTSSPRE